MPIVASVFTTIQIAAVLIELSGTGSAFSNGVCGSSSPLSSSSPISISSGDFILT
jgi:hypothetical protein